MSENENGTTEMAKEGAAVNLTPVMNAQHAAQLKVMLGKFSMPVEDYNRVVPPLVAILDGIMKNEFILIRNPANVQAGSPSAPQA